MSYKRFEELPVWNDAIGLAKKVYAFSSTKDFRGFSGLRDQLLRATLSVSNNIAEGFERGTNEELITFLYIAKGSAGEVRSMFHVIGGLEGWEDVSVEARLLLKEAEAISQQLGRWIESIKNSGYLGDRSQTDETRRADRRAHQTHIFMKDFIDPARSLGIQSMLRRENPPPDSTDTRTP